VDLDEHLATLHACLAAWRARGILVHGGLRIIDRARELVGIHIMCETCGSTAGGAIDPEIGLFELTEVQLAEMLAQRGCVHVAPLLEG
jgi:hypothetical protein